jgi:hypothetical protein
MTIRHFYGIIFNYPYMELILTIIVLVALWEGFFYAFAPTSWLGNQKNVLSAKMTPGAIVSEVRGKIAATVFGRNKGGAVIRNRITPINRRSASQQLRKQLLASFASQWRGLSQAERDSWNAASPNFPQTDNLGQVIYLTGEQLYVRCNSNLVMLGQSQIDVAPSPTSFDVIAFTSLTATADDGAMSLAFTPTVPAGYQLVVRATAPISAGKQSPARSAYRLITVIAAAETSPQAIGIAYTNVFGAITGATGQKIFIEMFLVESSSGLAGIPVSGDAVVLAT